MVELYKTRERGKGTYFVFMATHLFDALVDVGVELPRSHHGAGVIV